MRVRVRDSRSSSIASLQVTKLLLLPLTMIASVASAGAYWTPLLSNWNLFLDKPMSRLAGFLASCVMFACCSSACAAERYTEARITGIEAYDLNIVVFLQYISGDGLPQGNGGINGAIQSFLFLANSPTDITNRRHFLATAMLAQAQNASVRIRWEDAGANANRIIVLLTRGS